MDSEEIGLGRRIIEDWFNEAVIKSVTDNIRDDSLDKFLVLRTYYPVDSLIPAVATVPKWLVIQVEKLVKERDKLLREAKSGYRSICSKEDDG